MTTTDKTYTKLQLRIVAELCQAHGLEPSQISFDGDGDTPIFDYEAVCALSLKLTDIVAIDCKMLEPTVNALPVGLVQGSVRISNAECTVTLPDGRTRTCVDSAQVGETAGGRVFSTPREADGLAQNRAVRRGIRSVGINLWNAHNAFMRNGKATDGTLDSDPRTPNYREIHALATELDLIVDGDKSVYRNYIAASFAGVQSSKDLDDLQLHQLLVNLRLMAGLKRREQKAAA